MNPFRLNFKQVLAFVFLFSFNSFFAQVSSSASNQEIVLDPAKVLIFEKYVEYNHSFETGGYAQWKANNPDLYKKEMWYYTESFYIKRDHFTTGEVMNEGMIYIPRFENQRMPSTEVIIEFPGFKDVLVLIPIDKLIYKVN